MSRFISLSSTINIFFIRSSSASRSLAQLAGAGVGLGRSHSGEGHHERPRALVILLDPHVAADQPHEPEAERQTDAGAAIFGRSRVAIVGEDVEQRLRRAPV